MVDLAWRKLIIKVECAKNPDNEKHTVPDTDTLGSTVYICRNCPSFRTPAKETVGSHLSEVHHIETQLNHEKLSQNLHVSSTAPSDLQSPPLSPSVAVSRTPLVSGGSEGNWSGNSPLLQPHSPVSPLTKDNWQPRKKITVTLNASPTASVATVAPTVAAVDSDSPVEGMNSLDQLAYHDPGSSVDTSSSPVRSTSSSPEFQPKPSTQIPYECQFCGQRFVRLKSFEKHKIRQHSDLTLGSSQRDAAQSASFDRSHGGAAKNKHPVATVQVPCSECGRIFSSKQARDLHARVHRVPNNKYKCGLCGAIFRNLCSLKRHAISVHSIVPESAYGDNPKDKDFDVSTELSDLDSESSDSSSSSGRYAVKTQRGRKRRPVSTSHNSQLRSNLSTMVVGVASVTTATPTTTTTVLTAMATGDAPSVPVRRRRGRPRRSQTCTTKSFDNLPDLTPVDPLTIANRLDESGFADGRGETRYRTILPRPPGRTGSDPVKFSTPITVDGSHRKRPKRGSKKLVHKPSALAPLLADSRVGFDRNRAATTQAGQTHTHTVYLDPLTMAPTTYVTLDPTAYQNAYSLDLVATDESGRLVGKPPHVLTVAAAYASQLPVGSIAASGTDESETLVKTDASNECQPGENNSTFSALPVHPSSVIPGIQIYPSPWVEGQIQTTVPNTAISANASETGPTELQPSDPTPAVSISSSASHGSTTQMSIPMTQPLQLYPVLGPDGVTTMYYYMAAPVEFLQQGTTGTQDPSSTSGINVSSSESGPIDVSAATTATTSYYCTYANPVQWVTHTTESGELAMVGSANAVVSGCPNTTATTYDQSGETFELDDLFERDSVTHPDPGSDAFDSESSRVVEHVSLDCADQTIHDGEKIEVIELDAVQFEPQLQSETEAVSVGEADGEADSGPDGRMIATEVVDLGDAREVPYRADDPAQDQMELPVSVESSGACAAVTMETEGKPTEPYPADTLEAVEEMPTTSLSPGATSDLSSTNHPSTQKVDEATSTPSNRLLDPIGSNSIPPALHTLHTNIPSLTPFLLQTRNTPSPSFSHFNTALNDSGRDSLHTPVAENTETFDFPSVSGAHDATGYSATVEPNSNVCS